MRAFDPSSPEAARWRGWLRAELASRGVPRDARLEVALQPVGEVPVVRLSIDAWWGAAGGGRHERAVALVPVRRLLGCGWAGWPAYLAALRLLRAVG